MKVAGKDADHIHIHLEHLGADVIHERSPGIAESAKSLRADVTKEPIPEYYQPFTTTWGGIPTNYHGEVVTSWNGNPDTVVQGLMAIGECVSVLMALNRLGSNSLLDIVVFNVQPLIVVWKP